jgi:hypothetical protein
MRYELYGQWSMVDGRWYVIRWSMVRDSLFVTMCMILIFTKYEVFYTIFCEMICEIFM